MLPNTLEKSRLFPNTTLKIADSTIQTSNYEVLSTTSDFSLLLFPEFQPFFTQFSDLLTLDTDTLDLDANEKIKLKANIELIKSLPDSFPVLHLTQGYHDYLLTPRGLVLGTQENPDIQIFSESEVDLKIIFSHQRYFLCFSQDLPIYFKLNPSEEYKVQSGDTLKIGKLEFLVSRFNVGRWSHQGKRPSMEDADVTVYNLFIYDELPFSFFAVYDGHGGKSCSEFLKTHLHHHLRQKILNSPTRLTDVVNTLRSCILEAFKEIDQKYSEAFPELSRGCGSASIICIVFGDRILTINLGDSRAVLCRKGIAIDLSTDHKPTLQSELDRIVMCGGSVMLGRIDSRLAVSRAFGDFDYKNGPKGNLVEIEPELTQIFINPIEDEFLILGCDGLFEAYTSQSLVDIIRKRLLEMPPTEQNPNRVVREIINEAIFEGRTNDNVTASLVNLNSSISL